MAKKVPQTDFVTSALLAFAVAGLVVSSASAAAGIGKLAYDFQMSLPEVPATAQVASVASASGSGLTDEQVSAVLTLLAAFGAPQDTVTSVGAILKGENSDESEPSTATTVFANDTVTATVATDIPPPPSVCPRIARHLMRGSVGDDVAALQKFLLEQKLLTSDNVTGVFGSTTHAALARWQLAKGVIATTSPESGAGEVGTLTRDAIGRLCNPARQTDGTSDWASGSTPPTTLPTHVPPTPGWVGSTTLPKHLPPTPGWNPDGAGFISGSTTTPPATKSGDSGAGSSNGWFGR